MAIHAYTGRVTAKNTSLTVFTTDNTDYSDLVTGTNQGTIIDEITVNSIINATVTGTLRFFIYDATEIPTSALHSQVAVRATTDNPDAGDPTYQLVIRPLNLKLHNNQRLRITFTTSSTDPIGFHFTASVTEL